MHAVLHTPHQVWQNRTTQQSGCTLFYRALALRLNARVSELTLAAECAHADGESARAELERVRSRHQDDIDALEKRQRQLVSALKAVGGQSGPLPLDGGSENIERGGTATVTDRVERASSPVQPSGALLAVRDRNQNQAIQEAELAAAVMQVRPYQAASALRILQAWLSLTLS